MKELLFLLLAFVSATVSADWVKIGGPATAASEKFIDTAAIRQTGPMNTMRRVWELSNLAKPAANKTLSIKSHVEYDCKDRRVRILEESNFSEPWARGENLTSATLDSPPGKWIGIRKGSVIATIFNRVCPNDDSDAVTNKN